MDYTECLVQKNGMVLWAKDFTVGKMEDLGDVLRNSNISIFIIRRAVCEAFNVLNLAKQESITRIF